MYYLMIWISDIDIVAVFDRVSILSYTLPVQLYTPWAELIILFTTWAPYIYLYNLGTFLHLEKQSFLLNLIYQKNVSVSAGLEMCVYRLWTYIKEIKIIFEHILTIATRNEFLWYGSGNMCIRRVRTSGP